jgi:hypothetical protein
MTGHTGSWRYMAPEGTSTPCVACNPVLFKLPL